MQTTNQNTASPSETLKGEIIGAIVEIMTDFKLTQIEVSKRTGLDPSAVSTMLRGNTHRVGIPTLIRAFNKLGGTIELEITNPESLPARVRAAR
jgi:transcriptional regulator with XRE-family HTH domain